MRGALRASALALSLLLPEAGYAGEWTDGARLNWDTGEGKSYLIPALEVAGFVVGLNAFNRTVIDSDTYGSDGNTIWRNLRTAPVFDTDPFGINQVGHPYQGSYYYGFARSAGLGYWESLGYSLLGSFLWETAGETSKPSRKTESHIRWTKTLAFGDRPIGPQSSLARPSSRGRTRRRSHS